MPADRQVEVGCVGFTIYFDSAQTARCIVRWKDRIPPMPLSVPRSALV